VIAEFDHEMLRQDTPFPYAVQFEQHKLARLALERLREFPGIEIHFSARVAEVDARRDRVAGDRRNEATARGASRARSWSARTAGAAPCASRWASNSRAIPGPSASSC
jgi:2-polyprenyl-6-methoxyphenol hydroxylase-like FAD-dependent oxidoreductase